MTIAEGRVEDWAREEDLGGLVSSSSPSSSCVWGGAGSDGRLLTLDRETDTLERDRDLDLVTPVAGDCSPPGLNESREDGIGTVAEDISPNCCCCCCC
jgi:hypothetical protein